MLARICVLGRSLKEAERLLDILCEANADSVYRRRKNVGIMTDGTELIACSVEDEWAFVGEYFDYVFYDIDDLAHFCVFHGDILEQLSCRMGHSPVPREFQWCEVRKHG